MSNHTLTNLTHQRTELALVDIQAKADKARRLQQRIIREESEEDIDQLERLGYVCRKAAVIPVGLFEDGQRNARQHAALSEVHSLLDEILQLAHDACGGAK